MRRVLVTGGAGYVGSHTCKLLAAQGLEPVSFDSLTNGHREAVRWGPLVVGDVRDKLSVLKVMADHKIEAVFHFAALAYVGESMDRPDKYYDVNVGGTLAILEAMRELSVNRIIFSSSCATYGIPDRTPITEDLEQRPISPYGRTKLMGERMVSDYSKAFGIRHAILRYFNAAGCDPDGELVEKHEPETHLIPNALLAAGGFGPPLRIHGTDYETPDGTAIRDYVHVSDLAAAHRLALAGLDAGVASFAVNLGAGQSHSVRKVVDMVERVTGLKVPTEEGPRRPGDPPMLIAASDRASEHLGFRPQYSDLEMMVRTAWRGILSIHGTPARRRAQQTASAVINTESK